jgi:hypothetical protein
MNSFEEKIVRGKLTALEIGLQSGAIPSEIICKDARSLLTIENITEDLSLRIQNLLQVADLDEEE